MLLVSAMMDGCLRAGSEHECMAQGVCAAHVIAASMLATHPFMYAQDNL